MKVIPPGDDVVPTPRPVDDEPPRDRYCDLVLTGGVASGVVYPWAIVELARAYRFQSIGGTSVGAMAAALAAAAEYGRRMGHTAAFEPLRRLPAALGEMLPDGRTRMLSLFQPNKDGQRLLSLWACFARGRPGGKAPAADGAMRRLLRVATAVLRIYRTPSGLGALIGLALAVFDGGGLFSKLVLVLAGLLVGLTWAVVRDLLRGVVANGLGLCKGGTLEPPGPEGKRPGLSEWLHNGIQASAGMKKTDRPLTFRDLWNAPAHPGAPMQRCAEGDPVDRRAIDLQIITTNVTHGRPYRLPLADPTSRLFFKRSEWEDYFPTHVLDALVKVARPYAPSREHASDPPVEANTQPDLLELPGADLPVVVAARLSLSFPLLFAAVPLWAIDYEAPRGQRTLRRCWFTDGGVCSNFPIHMFDAAVPRWPTFGLWLDRRTPYQSTQDPKDDVCLPEYNSQGWGDNWSRIDPETDPPASNGPAPGRGKAGLGRLVDFLVASAMSAKDWRDRTSMRLPHVRNRVARMWLQPGEGGLHIAMPREQILQMAHRYGTRAGKLFVERYGEQQGQVSQAWREQRWVRLQLLIEGLRERLTGLAADTAWPAHTVPMDEAIAQAIQTKCNPVKQRGADQKIDPASIAPLPDLLRELEALETVLRESDLLHSKLKPHPELRLRAPL